MKTNTTAAEVLAALRKRYAAPQWAFLEEVRNRTGYQCGERESAADAIAMGCWKSTDFELHGFEVKVSRGDWLRELADPGKAEPIRRFCDRWWLAAPAGLVVPKEMPVGWGLMEVSDGARVKLQAPKLDAEPLSRPFLGSLLRAGAAWAEREEAAAQKALTLAAPLRPVVSVATDRATGRQTIALSCGHTVLRGFFDRTPKSARCLDCGSSGRAPGARETAST